MRFLLFCSLILLSKSIIIESQGQLLDNLLSSILPSSNVDENIDIQSSITEATVSSWNPLNWFQSESIETTAEYNPDIDLTTTEFAIRYGYAAEAHTVKTEDGYLLTLHRIPCGRSGCRDRRGRGQPIFLQHGILQCSVNWLLSGPEHSLAFILADMGYDVWLGNARGSTYSKRHVKLNNREAKYWDFSWHEMAIYDVPAEIDYLIDIRNNEQERGNETFNNNLLYVGHSMGTTMAFVLLSEKPEYNNKIKAVFAMAPVAYMSSVKSPLKILAPFSENIEMVIKFFGAKEFLPKGKMISFLANYGCALTDTERYICENTIFVICGFDQAQHNATLMPIILSHTPAGTSSKTVVHFAQQIHEGGSFKQYNYGRVENQIRYDQDTPPSYKLENIRIPIILNYADDDWLAGPQDAQLLYEKLNNSTTVEIYRVPINEFNHLDFLWGKDATQKVFQPLIQRMLLHQ